jgi:hypothetical protein
VAELFAVEVVRGERVEVDRRARVKSGLGDAGPVGEPAVDLALVDSGEAACHLDVVAAGDLVDDDVVDGDGAGGLVAVGGDLSDDSSQVGGSAALGR